MIGAGETSADMRYASGVATPDDIVWIEAGDRRLLLVSALEFDRVKQASPKAEVILDQPDGELPERLFRWAERLGVSAFTVPEDFPLSVADELRSLGLKITAAKKAFFPEREFKSMQELRWIIQALRGAEAGCRRAFEVLRESEISASDQALFWHGAPLTSEILRFEIDCRMMQCGMHSTGTICAGGRQGAQPHNVGQGQLYAGQPIVMDIFPRSAATGYWGDLTRTVVRGQAPEIVKKAFAAVLEAREAAKRHLAAGVSAALLHNEAADLLTAAGFPTGVGPDGHYGFFHGLGHGVGLEIHEKPRLSPRNVDLLSGGEVVTIEPGVYYPEWGGIRLEDMAYVPSHGPAQILTEIETFLEI